MASTLPVPAAPDLTNGNRCHNCEIFKQKWNKYDIAIGLERKPDNQRLATQLTVIGNVGLLVYNSFSRTSTEETTIASVSNKLENYCKPQQNITYERYA